jgi:hypothetical protein
MFSMKRQGASEGTVFLFFAAVKDENGEDC